MEALQGVSAKKPRSGRRGGGGDSAKTTAVKMWRKKLEGGEYLVLDWKQYRIRQVPAQPLLPLVSPPNLHRRLVFFFRGLSLPRTSDSPSPSSPVFVRPAPACSPNSCVLCGASREHADD